MEYIPKNYVSILPLLGKLIILRDVYSKNMGFNNYYEFISEKNEEETENIQQLITDLNDKLHSLILVITSLFVSACSLFMALKMNDSSRPKSDN